jgi:hypothetical protein
MALADYRLCDICESKVFYDSNLNYDFPSKDGKDQWGEPFTESELQRGYKLGHLGDWKVICEDCAKTHRCIIVPIE